MLVGSRVSLAGLCMLMVLVAAGAPVAAQTVGWVVYAPYAPEIYPPGPPESRAQIIDFNHRSGSNFPLPGRPVSVTVAPSGRAYVGNREESIGVYDAATGIAVTTIALAGIPWSIAVAPDGASAYAVQSGSVAVVDTATNAVTGSIPVCAEPVAIVITPDGGEAYVVNTDCGITVIDTATNTVSATIPVGIHPRHIALTPDGAFAYVVDPDSSTVSVIATASHTVTATIPVNPLPDAIAITPDGGFAYVIHRSVSWPDAREMVTLVSTTTNQVIDTYFWETNVLEDVAITPDGSFMVVASGGAFFEWKGSYILLEDAAFTVSPIVSGFVQGGPHYGFGVPTEVGAVSIARVGPCGDGVVAPSEACDDGNLFDGDGCDPNCTLAVCGNGYLDAGEQCDDGNLVEGDGCDSNCTRSGCGNGVVSPGEECEDGNAVCGDGCDPNCRASGCQNGYACAPAGEQCDDGNGVEGDGCDSNCTATGCGNGIASPDEACDDGNASSCDGCSAICQSEPGYVCGDGTLAPACGEQCDDGNVADGDGCSVACTLEPCGPMPATGCRRPVDGGKAVLTLLDRSSDDRDQLVWKWLRGSATTPDAFGRPDDTSSYQLCIYDAERIRLSSAIAAGGLCGRKPCWAVHARSFVYRSESSGPGGIARVRLQAGSDGRAQIQVRGRGAGLDLPAPPFARLPLTVQLKRLDDSVCWEATYGTVIENEAGAFRARAD